MITAITAQNTVGVDRIEALSKGMVRQQIQTVLDDLAVDSIKIGMVLSSNVVKEISEALVDYQGPVVLDPVMISKSGDSLLDDDAIDALRTLLLPEVAVLANTQCALDSDQALAQACDLLSIGANAVLVKGGHGIESVCTDYLITNQQAPIELTSPRIATANTHGTGCTYSAAIAAHLAKSETLVDAVIQSHDYLTGAIQAADQLDIGSGHGPVHHFYRSWQ